MNKKVNKIFLLLVSFLVIPLTFMLAGCGATAVNSANSVSFVSSIQEDGNAVYELDLNAPIKLPYKINPSSAYGYAPIFTAVSGISGDNMETYSLNSSTGEFCIKRADFKDVEVEVSIGQGAYKDICKIKLKKYPNQIGVYDETVANKINNAPKISLACGQSYQINVAGLFGGDLKLMTDSAYNFLVEADENSKTIINVQNENRLNFIAYNNYGTAKVKVALCDYFGNVIKDEAGFAKYAIEIEVVVYKTCEYLEAKFDGIQEFISSKNQDETFIYEANVKHLKFDAGKNVYVMKFSADFYDKYDRLINEGNLDIKCFVSKDGYVEVDNDNHSIYISKPPSGENINVSIEVWSNAALDSGEYCMTKFNVKFINF